MVTLLIWLCTELSDGNDPNHDIGYDHATVGETWQHGLSDPRLRSPSLISIVIVIE